MSIPGYVVEKLVALAAPAAVAVECSAYAEADAYWAAAAYALEFQPDASAQWVND